MTAVIGTQSRHYPQAWLRSAWWDATFILAPSLLSATIVLMCRQQFEASPELPLWAWVSFVLFVDVAHVYGTLFRTYLDPRAFAKNKFLLVGIPIVCWIVGCLLYSVDGILFWRVLAYLAIFHFIRQQYGFAVLYARKEPLAFMRWRWLDALLIYCSTVYPLLFWHTHMPRGFIWFMAGDFVTGIPAMVADSCLVLYACVAVTYVIKELVLLKCTKAFNIPRNLLIAGTALSWWAGIVAVNSDFAFTFTNVVTHGIPYMGLIWTYHHRSSASEDLAGSHSNTQDAPLHADLYSTFVTDSDRKSSAFAHESGLNANELPRENRDVSWLTKLSNRVMVSVPLYLAILGLLAFFEEGLWDGFIWREHAANIFAVFSWLPPVTETSVLSFVIPFLALPQSTHYVLDGFIWRIKDRTSIWSA